MIRQKEVYEYVDKDEQYSTYDLSDCNPVVAEYVRSTNPIYEGIPYIEALPKPIDETGCLDAYKYTVPFDPVKAKACNQLEQLEQIPLLQRLRFPLPFSAELEYELYRALCESYAARFQFYDPDVPLPIYAFNQEDYTLGKLIADQSSSSVCGFTLLGNSGSGKTSAVHTLLSRYPQVIQHPCSVGRMTQIVYLFVNCPPNSNFNQLYTSIAAEIDKALGITNCYYEQRVNSISGLHKKHDIVKRLIEAFGVGIIIFDEIQLINFSGVRENTFESLLTLSNETKVAIAAIGTEDAVKKMFPNERTARRVGSMIQSSTYCNDPAFFKLLVMQLSRYYWFDKPMDVTDELVEALYKYSRGIIAHLVTLYSYMNIDYIKADKKPAINVAFVKSTIKRHFKNLDKLLAQGAKLTAQEEALQDAILLEGAENLRNALVPDKQAKFLETIREMLPDTDSMQILSNVIRNIQMCYDCYSTNDITVAFNKVYPKARNSQFTEQQITQTVLATLQKVKKPTASKGTKVSTDQINLSLASAFKS